MTSWCNHPSTEGVTHWPGPLRPPCHLCHLRHLHSYLSPEIPVLWFPYENLAIWVLGVLWTPKLEDGPPKDCREQPWKPADPDVLIQTSCVKEGRNNINCSLATVNTEGTVRSEAGVLARGGEVGKAENLSKHLQLVQCRPLLLGWGGGAF